MTDIVERLRSHTPPKIKDLDAAAAEIDRLRSRLAAWEAAARKVVCQRCNDSGFEPWSDFGGAVIEPCSDCSDLRALLGETAP